MPLAREGPEQGDIDDAPQLGLAAGHGAKSAGKPD
jgi:hypothetical protein